ncbi:NHL repeat domain protein [Desulfocucumis palustris]|uniref:NHL repeat domain protein n=1 Tax=Desulfocucumis palustris TaxID=1898651 RepID=A0A2L2XEP5_9FIRM|nr:phage tail protein [Desulfocucumis palustris]GBF34817.1 NHL repeat domain protein [Desulfocucumis palustris]
MYGEVNFFSVNKKNDWEKGWADNIHFGDEGISLKTGRQYVLSRFIGLRNLMPHTGINDMAVENNGLFYLLDDRAGLWVYDYRSRQNDALLKEGHGLFTGQAMVALLEDVVLVADPLSEHKLTAFSPANGQMLWSLDSFEDNSIFPLGMAGDGRNNLYVVTPLGIKAGGYAEIFSDNPPGILKIDLSGKITDVFSHREFLLRRPATAARRGNSLFTAVSGDGFVYILDSEANSVYVFSPKGELSLQFQPGFSIKSSGLALDSDNNIYLGDGDRSGREAEDGRFIHKFDRDGRYIGVVPGFRGGSDKLLTDDKNNLYVWNGEDSSISILEQRQKIRGSGSGLPRGTYFSASLDSTVEEMHWHKLLLEAELPDNTQIVVSHYCSDSKNILFNEKTINMDDFIKDGSISAREKIAHLSGCWSQPVVNPGDALFHGARGRYLWLRIELIGSGDKTPVLKKARVYYPRMSYLSYLPAVYQEDNNSRDFLERYLAMFESFLMDMEEKIEGVAKYFDPDAVSGPFLKWLAAWLAIVLDDSWSEEQLRLFIKKSPELYKKRGTKRAIEEIIEIYTGQKPFIIEYFQFKYLKDKPEMKGLLANLYGLDPYCFTVLIKKECVETEQRLLAVQKILDREKPAFTEARLVVLQPWIYMDMHTYLGINTYLSELTLLRLDQRSAIPFNTVLVDVDMDNRLGLHSRMEIDAKVKY